MADRNVTVLRDRDTVTFTIPMDKLITMREERKFSGMYTPIQQPFIVEGYKVCPLCCKRINENIATLGYREGDQIVAIDSVSACSGEVIRPMLAERKGSVANVRVLRVAADETDVVRPAYCEIMTPISEEGTIGITLQATEPVKITEVEYGFFESIPAGIKRGGQELASYWQQLKMIVNPETKSYKEVGGFIAIGSIFPATWNWQSFWALTAFISIALAIMNLLPIPGLDGGHALFTLWELITRRKPSDKFLEIMQYIGLGLLLLLLVFANGNDIIKLFMN